MFKPGQIVKLKGRPETYPFFVLVSDDWHNSDTPPQGLFFFGTVIINHSYSVNAPFGGLAVGHHSNGWEVRHFDLSAFEELKKWL